MSKTKNTKIRAFIISSMNMNKDAEGLLNEFNTKLEETDKSEIRMMPIASTNTDTEFDLCCTFEKNIVDNNENLFGTMLRIKHAGDVGDISSDLLSQKKFGVSEIVGAKNNSETYADINRFYFLIKGKYLVCNLQGNRNIKGLETYINWLLNTQAYQFSPKIVVPPDMKLSDLKNITLGGLSGSETKNKTTTKRETKLFDVAKDLLFDLFREQSDLKDIDLENVLTAKLILDFKKPRNMTEEEYQKQYGALLKHISDTDDVKFTGKNGKTVKGSTIESSRSVSININADGVLNEAELKLEMGRFITEIENEEAN